MGKKQKSKAKAGVEDMPADNSPPLNEDALADEESTSEHLDADNADTVNLEDKIAELEEALLRSRADSKDLRVNSTPSLSSFVEFLEKLFKACSRLSTTGNSSFNSLSTPYL